MEIWGEVFQTEGIAREGLSDICSVVSSGNNMENRVAENKRRVTGDEAKGKGVRLGRTLWTRKGRQPFYSQRCHGGF